MAADCSKTAVLCREREMVVVRLKAVSLNERPLTCIDWCGVSAGENGIARRRCILLDLVQESPFLVPLLAGGQSEAGLIDLLVIVEIYMREGLG